MLSHSKTISILGSLELISGLQMEIKQIFIILYSLYGINIQPTTYNAHNYFMTF